MTPSGAPRMTHMRAGDDDRDVVARALRVHHLAGRLTLDEFEERLARAASAVTLGDLAALYADLPVLSEPVGEPTGVVLAQNRRRLPRIPGRSGFSERTVVPAPVQRAGEAALEHLAPALTSSGYRLLVVEERRVVFGRTRRPGWTIAVAILVFPLGLVALVVTNEERVEIDLRPASDGGTALLAHGVAPLRVRRAFARLRE